MAHVFRVNRIDSFYDESYFNVRYYQIERTLDQATNSPIFNTSEYQIELCGDNYPFDNIEFLDRSGLRDQVYCPLNQDYSISGSFSNTVYRYVEIKVNKCNNSTYEGNCKTTQEIDQILTSGDFSIGLQNSSR